MRRIYETLTVIAAAVVLTSSAHAADVNIATIDLNKAFKEYKKTKEADSSLKTEMEKFKDERDDRMKEYRVLVDKITAMREAVSDPALNKDAREKKSENLNELLREAQAMEREIQDFTRNRTRFIQDRSRRLREEIVKEIQELLKTLAKGKYDLVFDVSGLTMNGTSPLLYHSDTITDITGEVVKQLNK